MPDVKPNAHLETILTSAGLPAEDVTAILSLPEDKIATFDPKPYLDKVKANFSTQLQNDPAFFNDLTLDKLPAEVKKKVQDAQYGRAAGIVRQKFLKALGLTEADYADLPEDQQKDLEAFIPAMAEKFAKTKTGDKELQQQLIAARKELEKHKEDFDEEKIKTKYEGLTNERIKAAILNANLIAELSAIPGLKIPAGDLAKTALDSILAKYGFEKVGDFGIELRQKANPQMKVLKNGSSQEMTLKDALTELATERNWIDKKVDPTKGKGIVTVDVDPTKDGLKTVVAPHVAEKISKKIAAAQD